MCKTSSIVLSLEIDVTKSRKKVGAAVDIKEIGWYCTQEQESASEAIAKDCSCRRWMMVELVLEAAMAQKVDVSSMDVQEPTELWEKKTFQFTGAACL